MANTKSLRLAVGSVFPKGPGKIYFYRYQVDGRRKTVSLQTANRAEALKKVQELIPIVKASTPEIVAAHVEFAKGFNIKDNPYLLNAFSTSIGTCKNRCLLGSCKSCKICQSVVVEDMGKNYLSQLFENNNAESDIVAIFNSLSELLKKEWKRIAIELTSWCCACKINPYQI